MNGIVFFVSSMHGGGAERVAALLCNRWAAEGRDVTLVPIFSGRGTCLYPLNERVRLVYLADRVGTTRKTPITMLRRLWEMRRIVREARAKSVLSFLPHVNIPTLLVVRGLGVPVVVSERTYPPAMPLGPFWSILRKLTYPFAKQVVMQTEGGFDWLAREIPRANGAVISNPCAFPLPSSEPRVAPQDIVPKAKHLLLAVGRLDELKQFNLLLHAFAELAPCFPDWDLAILGEGEERAALEAQSQSAGLAGRVHMPGRVGNVADWYGYADVYVMTSRFEGFPNTLLEALAYGLPAVSFDCATGPAEMIEDGVNGFLVPPEDGVEGLVSRLEFLMGDGQQRQTLAAHAASVRQRFSFGEVGLSWDVALGIEKQDV